MQIKFDRIYIEITNICNLSCDFCPSGAGLHSAVVKRRMTPREFEHIIFQIKPYTKEIYLHVMGEPLTHPQLEEILHICAKNDMITNITTNGTLIGEKNDILLNAKNLRTINISLHSFKGSFEKFNLYLNDIFQFIEKMLINTGTTCKLRIWNIKSEDSESELNQYIFSKLEEKFDLPFELKNECTKLEGIRLGKRVFLSQAERFSWPSLEGEEYEGKAFCLGLRKQAAILADGRVVPCCLDGQGIMELGNIFHEGFKEILKGKRAGNIYNGYSQRCASEELCRKCSYRLKFN